MKYCGSDMTDQHVRIKHTWSLADKYLENKSIFSYTYDGETFPPLGNCMEKIYFTRMGENPLRLQLGNLEKNLLKNYRECAILLQGSWASQKIWLNWPTT
jgi:hypothetical protein